MKKKQNGMYDLLAVIVLMLAASIYASCSSEDDDYDNGWVELETMARGTRAASGENNEDQPTDSVEEELWHFHIRSCDTLISYTIVEELGEPILAIDIEYHWTSGILANVKPSYEIHPVEETIRFKNIRYGHITNFGFSNWKLSGILFVRWNDNGLACSKPIIFEDDISSYIINLDDFE